LPNSGVLLLGKSLYKIHNIFDDESGNVQGENSECLGLLPSVAIGFHLLFTGKII
jgi:hypothetical protein